MKLTLLVIVVLVVCVSLFGNGRFFKPDEERNVFVDSAETFLERLLKKDFEAAASDFDETMSRVLPAEKLQQTLETVLKQAGAFQERTGGYGIVFLTCAFEKAPLDIQVVFDAEKRIAGLYFTPAQPPYSPPGIRRSAFLSRSGSGRGFGRVGLTRYPDASALARPAFGPSAGARLRTQRPG